VVFTDIVLLLLTAAVAVAAVLWACRELGGVIEWLSDAEPDTSRSTPGDPASHHGTGSAGS
jgi:hypothetical protein